MRWAACAQLFDAGRLDDEGTLAAIADCRKRYGELLDPHTAVGYAVAQQHRRDPAVPMVALATAHPAKFPDAVEKATGERPRAAAAAGRPAAAARAGRRPAERHRRAEGADRRSHGRGHGAAAARCGHEHVKVTTLANGLRVAVDEMPEVESASLGIWVDVRHAARERPSSTAWRTCSSTWRSRAPGRRSARAIAEEIENVGGSLNAYTGARDHRLSRLGPEGGRRRSASRWWPTSCATRCSIPTSCSASAA